MERFGAAVPAGKLFGWLSGSELKVTPSAWQAARVVQLRLTVSTPVPPYPLEIQTYGVRPWKTPTPPRTCCLADVPGFQLKPTRGSHVTFVRGFPEVERPKIGRAWCR